MARDAHKYFRIETNELVTDLSQDVLELEKNSNAAEVKRLFRLAHTLKEAARVVKQPEIAELAHGIENVLMPYRESADTVPRDQIDRMLTIIDAVKARL